MRFLSESLAKLGNDVTVATQYKPERYTQVINRVIVEEFHVSEKFHNGYQGEVDLFLYYF